MYPVFFVLYVDVFFLGICFASFLNVVIYRLPKGISFFKGRSYCPSCKRTLAWYDLIPILSYILLKGKCRYCGTHISYREVIFELVGGCIALFCVSYFGYRWYTLFVFLMFLLFITIMMIDIDTMTIANGLLVVLAIIIGWMCYLQQDLAISTRIIGFFIISLPMYVLILVIPDCFGGGDIKLIGICGFLLGWQSTLVAGFIAILTGGMYATYLLISKKATKYTHIPFGPFLLVGVSVAFLYGSNLVSIYQGIVGM